MNRPDQGLARDQRLTRSSDFRAAYDGGRKAVGRYMVLYALARPEGARRLGVVTGRKIGGAVQRNRARRLLREAYRRNRHRLSATADVVLVARAALLAARASEIEAELMALAERAGLWKENRIEPPGPHRAEP